MTEKWSTLRELLLPALAEANRDQRCRAVEHALREAVRSGRLHADTRLPSSRDLAAQLNLARGTVTSAYAQLVGEGYLVSQHGSGTRVARTGAPAPARPSADQAQPPSWRYDLRPGLPALSAFPRSRWLAAARAGLAALPDSALGYPDPAGLPQLRAELAGYLGRVRAVAVEPDDVLITNGGAEALALLGEVLRDAGHRKLAVENPSHPGQRDLLGSRGIEVTQVPTDCDGIQVDALAATDARVVLVTAAHQFPLGTVLHPDRRHALLAWARERDGLVLEDDYDAEHRYDRPALGAMQAIEPDRVVYLGSLSKTLAPALRLGWLVPPRALLDDLVNRKRLHDLGCSPLPQAAFAELLRSGGYDRHLRKTRLLYRERRDALLAALSSRLPSWRPLGIAAGLHLVVRLPAETDDLELQHRLAAEGVNAIALSSYSVPRSSAAYPGLVLGYAALSPDRLREAVSIMAAVYTLG